MSQKNTTVWYNQQDSLTDPKKLFEKAKRCKESKSLFYSVCVTKITRAGYHGYRFHSASSRHTSHVNQRNMTVWYNRQEDSLTDQQKKHERTKNLNRERGKV